MAIKRHSARAEIGGANANAPGLTSAPTVTSESRLGERPPSSMPRERTNLPPNPFDVEIGERLRRLRKMRKVSQSSLGEALNVSFQAIQKYECGRARLSAHRLKDIADFFDVRISDLLGEAGPTGDKSGLGTWLERSYAANVVAVAFDRIEDPKLRRGLTRLIQSLGSAEDPAPEDDGASGHQA